MAPSGASSGAIWRSASAVWCAFTHRRTVTRGPRAFATAAASSGVAASTATRSGETGPVISSPADRMAAT